MIDLYESGRIGTTRPDVVSFNQVMNACAFEKPSSQVTSEEIIRIAIDTFEMIKQNNTFGRPNQNTYPMVLLAIENHMPEDDDKRIPLVEAIFRECAQDGLVSIRLVTILNDVLPYPRFRELMGKALLSSDGEKLSFDLNKLPSQWTVNFGRKKITRSRRQVQPPTFKQAVSRNFAARL